MFDEKKKAILSTFNKHYNVFIYNLFYSFVFLSSIEMFIYSYHLFIAINYVLFICFVSFSGDYVNSSIKFVFLFG